MRCSEERGDTVLRLGVFQLTAGGPRPGVYADGYLYDVSAVGAAWASSFDALLTLSRAELISRLAALDLHGLPRYGLPGADLTEMPSAGQQEAGSGARLLAPLGNQEVWAAGVTYVRSREARTEEAVTKDVYQRVYEAPRPELFFKAMASRMVGPGGSVAIRGDSTWDVPEPELALVLNTALEVVGYTIGNDMSSRSIEGENPLYLPQAKVYTDCCALGPLVTVATDDLDARNLEIGMTITRAGATVFSGATSTADLHRTFDDLTDHLGRYNTFPHGAILLTGTGLVPPASFTLRDDDEVTISIASIGSLRNTVRRLTAPVKP